MLIAMKSDGLLSAGILLAPILLTICFACAALYRQEPERKRVWAAYRIFGQLILAGTIVAWWITWDSNRSSGFVSTVASRWPGTSETFSAETLLFWSPPTLSLGIFLFFCYTIDHKILKLKWNVIDTLSQVFWTAVSFVIPLLLVAIGFDRVLHGKASGIGWLLAAGLVSKVGTGFLRRARGLKFNALKSGELRNRALGIARRMGVMLSKIYVVPAGKGHLTNAYGMSHAIALTDNLGKFLTKRQMEFVISHEMAHVKLKHGRNNSLLVITIFSTITLFLFSFPQAATRFYPLLQIVIIIGPLMILHWCSRRFEYSADREAVDFTGDPETAIRALANLQRFRELPDVNDSITELFMTHPNLTKRVHAIAKRGNLPPECVTDILEQGQTPASPSEKN
jgi:Zn-dependent protease with chaperone function